MTVVWEFVKLTRPHFLLGGAVMYAVGAGGASRGLGTYLLGQGLVTCAQVTAHYVNEYADLEVDRGVVNRTFFSGGSGVLATGRLSPAVALRAGAVTTLAALLFAGLLISVSIPAAALGLVALSVSWAYSMPPVRLLNTGWGELATSLVVAGAVPTIGALANGGSFDSGLAGRMIVLILIHMAMMLAFELPDLATDSDAGKTVLAVRMGQAPTIRLIEVLLAGATLAVMTGILLGDAEFTWWLVAVGFPATVTVAAAHRSWYGTLTVAAVGTLVAFAIVVLIQG